MTREQRKTIRFKYQSYKKKAKSREIYFDLSLADFTDLVTASCYFCGVAPCTKVNRFINKQGQKTFDGKKTGLTLKSLRKYDVYLNGVDRFENTMPYVASNCVPACKMCNMAKGAASLESFLIWLNNIIEYNLEWFNERNKETREDYDY